jgi:hypothetical protein
MTLNSTPVTDHPEKTIYIVIGCDTDPDRDYFIKGTRPDRLSWRGMLEGIPRAKERLARLTDTGGRSPVFTWLLRADHQIREMCSAYDYVLTQHRDFLRGLERSGDELGWHPHFWRYDDAKKLWYQEHADIDWQVAVLEEAWAAYQQALPGRGRTVRTGWTYHNNRTFATLDRLGVTVDISAIPGIRIDPSRNQARPANFFDWSITPSHPYRPSAADYRREAKGSESSYATLEVPVLVSRSFWWGMLSGAVLTRKMRDLRQIGYALSRPAYMATLSVKPVLFRPMLAQIRRDLKRRGWSFYVTLLHPDELTENIHPVFSLENMEKNLEAILKLAERMDARVRYIRGCDAPGCWREIAGLSR